MTKEIAIQQSTWWSVHGGGFITNTVHYTLHVNVNKGSYNQIMAVNQINQRVCIENRNIWQKTVERVLYFFYCFMYIYIYISQQEWSAEEPTKLENTTSAKLHKLRTIQNCFHFQSGFLHVSFLISSMVCSLDRVWFAMVCFLKSF